MAVKKKTTAKKSRAEGCREVQRQEDDQEGGGQEDDREEDDDQEGAEEGLPEGGREDGDLLIAP